MAKSLFYTKLHRGCNHSYYLATFKPNINSQTDFLLEPFSHTLWQHVVGLRLYHEQITDSTSPRGKLHNNTRESAVTIQAVDERSDSVLPSEADDRCTTTTTMG